MLGISHPAGFPTYNLFAKAWTFLPLGSVAFRINLLSALWGCLGLVCLYVTATRVLALLEPEADPSGFTWPALLPAGFLAFAIPFWFHSLVAEVYTLHVLFTCAVLLLLILWRQKDDLRFLFLAALVYGLSAGNHPTVALYLPAILVLFFCWNKTNSGRNLALSIVFFLIGLSVYLYLPLRSLTEPSMDWGNPETLSGFIYQVTDQKDVGTHFSVFQEKQGTGSVSQATSILSQLAGLTVKVGQIVRRLLEDLNTSLLPVTVLGFLAGGYLCFRKNKPLFFFFLIVVGFNSAFFTFWRRESFLPSYIVACLLTSIFLYVCFVKRIENRDAASESASGQIRWRGIALAVLFFLIPWMASTNYLRVDRSGLYFGESLLKRVFLSLDERALFISGISWFNFYYHQDVTRLREDVTAVKAWDLLAPDPPSMLTRRRYPHLNLPVPSRYNFDSRETARIYVLDLLRLNATERPVLVEQNKIFLDEFDLVGPLKPHRNILLKFFQEKTTSMESQQEQVFDEWEEFLEADARQPGLLRDWTWSSKVAFYLESYAQYCHDRGWFPLERRILNLMEGAVGSRGPGFQLNRIDNLVRDEQLPVARKQWLSMKQMYPEHFQTGLAEGILLRAEGNLTGSLSALKKSVKSNPAAFRPRLELATAYGLGGNRDAQERELNAARVRAGTLKQFNLLRHRFKNFF